MRYIAWSETAARRSMYLFFVLTPLFFLPVPWIDVLQSKMFLFILLAVAGFSTWVLSAINDSKLRILLSPLLGAALLVPLAYVVSAIASGGFWESFMGDGWEQDTVVGVLIWYLALLLSASILSEGEDRSYRALRLLLLGGAAVLVVQVSHLAFPALTFGGALPTLTSSIVGTWHDLAIFLGLLLFLSLSLVRTPVGTGFWRYGAIGIGIASFLFLVIINYRDVWIGIVALAFFYAFLLYRTDLPRPPHFSMRSALLPVLFGVVSLAMYFGGSVVQGNLPSRLQVSQFEVRPSWMGTLAVGREVFAEPTQLFFGSGPSTFSQEWGRYKPLSVNTTQFWNVDFYSGIGFIPTSFITTGILGFLAWGAVCAALLLSLWTLMRSASASDKLRVLLLSGAIYLTAFHILYVPSPALSVLTFLIFGALVAEEFYRRVVQEKTISFSRGSVGGKIIAAGLSVLTLVVLFGGVQGVRAVVSDTLLNRAIFLYNNAQDLSAASRSLSWAVTVWPRNDRAHRAGVELGILQLGKLISTNDPSKEGEEKLRATLSTAIKHGLAAVALGTSDYQNWLALAGLYRELAGIGVEGAEGEARKAYLEARKNNPRNPLSYVGEAQLDIGRGDDVGARRNLEDALRMKPDFAAALFLLSQVEARSGNLEKAAGYAAAVTEVAAGDPLGWYNLGTILYAQRRYEGAIFSLERAVGLQNSYANAIFLLGLAYYRTGRTPDALSVLEAVQKLNPSDAALTNIITTIKSGRDPFEGETGNP